MSKPKANAPANSNVPLPIVPPGAIRVAKIGGTIALIAAAAMSAQTLVALGHILGYHGKIAWLLPASLDVYAGTSIWVGYRIPAAHPASVIARRDAVLALTLSVCCNAMYHMMLLAGSQLPKPLTDTLLVLVGALPPLVVERIFHLQMAVRNGSPETSTEADDAFTASTPKPSTPAAAAPEWKPAPNAPASTAPSFTPDAESPAPSTRVRPASTANTRSETRRVASGPIPIQSQDRVKIVREWIDAAAGDHTAVPLKRIEERFGVSQPTASRIRAAASTPAAPAKQVADAEEEEPEQVLEAIS